MKSEKPWFVREEPSIKSCIARLSGEIPNRILIVALNLFANSDFQMRQDLGGNCYTLSERIRRLSRLAVAVGGFLIMMGMFLLGVIALALADIIDISALVNETSLLMFMLALLSIGVLDVVAGIILSRGEPS